MRGRFLEGLKRHFELCQQIRHQCTQSHGNGSVVVPGGQARKTGEAGESVSENEYCHYFCGRG